MGSDVTHIKDLEKQLRDKTISAAVDYYNFTHKNKKEFTPGDRILYARRVFDEKEIANLVDSALDFWLTTGRYTDRFERDFADFLGVKYSLLVN